jgi:hypothetical protein
MTHVVWAPPEWLPRRSGVLAGLAERHPARTIFLVPCRADERRRGRRVVQDFAIRRRARGAVRGDRAPARRRGAPPSGVRRAAAADLRPARVLPLARAPDWNGRRSTRSSTSATGSSSTRTSGGRARRVRPSPGSSTGSASRTSPGGAGCRGGRARERWPGSAEASGSRRGPARGRAAARGWLRSRLRRRCRSRAATRTAHARSRSTATPSTPPAAPLTAATCSRRARHARARPGLRGGGARAAA